MTMRPETLKSVLVYLSLYLFEVNIRTYIYMYILIKKFLS